MDNYVDAIIKVKVPEWQIGEEVKIYFKDTMYISGICEPDYTFNYDESEEEYDRFDNQMDMSRVIDLLGSIKDYLK